MWRNSKAEAFIRCYKSSVALSCVQPSLRTARWLHTRSPRVTMRNALRSLAKDLKRHTSHSVERAHRPYSRDEERGFYQYTTGTWLYNRTAQLSVRQLAFDVDALILRCIKAGHATSCVSFTKLAEGTSNRGFVARLDNGKELIARLPFPVAGPAHLTTASEVATMEFARMSMKTPTPVTLDYCTDASETEVGSEFIIMEKVPGVQLYSRWNDDLPINDFASVTRDLVQFERAWADARLPYIGSLYFAKDLPKNTPSFNLPGEFPRHVQWGRFVIGPSVARKFWRGGRAQLNVDRGPWKDLRSQISATIQCEIEWLRRCAKPYPRHSPLYRSERENSPATHIDVLQRCLQVLPFLPDLPEFSTFCVWHPDLHASNIIVDETGPLTPRFFIDWQTATVETLVDIPMPPFLSFDRGKYIKAVYGPAMPPSLPDGFSQLPEHEQQVALTEQRLAARSQYYHHVTQRLNPALHAARFSSWQSRYQALLECPSHTWEEGVAPLKQVLIDIWQSWDEIAPHTPCPVSFDPTEVYINEKSIVGWAREESVKMLYREIGLGPDGFVKENKLDEVRRRNREALERTVAEVDHPDDKAYIRRRWPFQDDAFSPTAETCL